MKNLLFVICLFSVVGICSCTKDDNSIPLVGKWNVVSDSTYYTGIGPNGTPSFTKYVGQPGDYFNFTAQGKAYFKEGNTFSATATYKVTGNNVNLVYSNFVVNDSTINATSGGYIIAAITPRTLVLTNQFITPGGATFTTVKLSK